MLKINFILIILISFFSVSCSKDVVEKSIIKEKSMELQMIDAYKEGLNELRYCKWRQQRSEKTL